MSDIADALLRSLSSDSARALAESLAKFASVKPTRTEAAPDTTGLGTTTAAIEEQEIAPEQSAQAIESVNSMLGNVYAERVRQAKASFNVAIALVILGVVLVFAGVVMLYLDYTTAGVVSAVIGVVTEIISAVLFKFNNDTNARLDALTPDLVLLERARIGMKFIKLIEDKDARDRAIAELAKELISRPLSRFAA